MPALSVDTTTASEHRSPDKPSTAQPLLQRVSRGGLSGENLRPPLSRGVEIPGRRLRPGRTEVVAHRLVAGLDNPDWTTQGNQLRAGKKAAFQDHPGTGIQRTPKARRTERGSEWLSCTKHDNRCSRHRTQQSPQPTELAAHTLPRQRTHVGQKRLGAAGAVGADHDRMPWRYWSGICASARSSTLM